MTLSDQHDITVEDEGRLLAAATVRRVPDRSLVQAEFRVEPGHVPVGTRSQLVDATFDISQLTPGTRLEVTLPAGDAEILARVRGRCTDVETRAAGASCLLHGEVAPGSTSA